MKRHPYLLLLLTTLCFSACTHEKTKDFKQYPATELTFEEIRIDSIMDYPRQLRIAGDSLLIINDHVEDKAVLLYNLSDSSCVRTVSIGQGPGEVLSPNWIDLAGDSLNVLSRNNGKINRYALNDLVLIVLWTLAALRDTGAVSVLMCFVAFFVNDLYGFRNWRRMLRQQSV